MTKTWTIKITKESIKNAAKKAWTNVRTFKMTRGKFGWVVTALWATLVIARWTGFVDTSQMDGVVDAAIITVFLAMEASRNRKAEKAAKEKAE